MKILCVLVFIVSISTSYSQAKVCYGDIKNYSVDTDEGGTPNSTPNGTLNSTYFWEIFKKSDGALITTATIDNSTTNAITINWGTTPPEDYMIMVTETNNGCAGTPRTLDVTINPKPTVKDINGSTVFPAAVAVCMGSNTTIIATPNETNITAYNWTSPAGYLGTTNTDTLSITAATTAMAGDYTLTLTDANGCTSIPVTATLTVNALPDAAITPSGSTTFCTGNTVTLTAPSGIGLSYTWQKNTNSIAGQTAISHIANQSGDYTVTVTDGNGCANTSPATQVTVNPLPTFTTASIPLPDGFGNINICTGATAALSSTITSGPSPFTYQWIDLGGPITSATNASYNATLTSDYQLKLTDNNGCSALSPVSKVQVRDYPNANITAGGATTFCAGLNVELKTGSTPVPGFTYQWIKGGGALAETNYNFIASESGDYTVRVVDTNFSSNCTTTTSPPTTVDKKELPITSSIRF